LFPNFFLDGDSFYGINVASGGTVSKAVGKRLTTGQAETMKKLVDGDISRRALLGVFAATTVTAAPVYSKTFGILKGAGDIRKISMRSGRTGETLEMIYWIEGEYIKDAMKEINYFMRDWREDLTVNMDRRNFDIVAATHSLLETTEPYQLLSGYRSPRTNALLRRRSRGVAKKSLHIKGMAADVRLSSRSVSQIVRAGYACNAGGIGKYSRSNFVHIDSGARRTWGS
jgi:uncharacterized protein YcbK (DUF882 family)